MNETQEKTQRKMDPVSLGIIGVTVVAVTFMLLNANGGMNLFGDDRRQLHSDDIVVLDTSSLINDAGKIDTEEDLSAKEIRERIEGIAKDKAKEGKIVIRHEYVWDAPEENIIPVRF